MISFVAKTCNCHLCRAPTLQVHHQYHHTQLVSMLPRDSKNHSQCSICEAQHITISCIASYCYMPLIIMDYCKHIVLQKSIKFSFMKINYSQSLTARQLLILNFANYMFWQSYCTYIATMSIIFIRTDSYIALIQVAILFYQSTVASQLHSL